MRMAFSMVTSVPLLIIISRNARRRRARTDCPPLVDSGSDAEAEPIEHKADVEVQYGEEGPSVDVVPGSLGAWLGDCGRVEGIFKRIESRHQHVVVHGPGPEHELQRQNAGHHGQ